MAARRARAAPLVHLEQHDAEQEDRAGDDGDRADRAMESGDDGERPRRLDRHVGGTMSAEAVRRVVDADGVE